MIEQHPLWVFGYGSLMWKPGFQPVETVRARITGVHRAPCIFSWEHRGTRDSPGIVLGLDRGGACVGMAMRVAEAEKDEVLAYLRARELVTNVYRETVRNCILADGRLIRATTYVADQTHEQYAGRLDQHALIQQIRGAVGNSGPNETYITDTVAKMRAMGIRDTLLEAVANAL